MKQPVATGVLEAGWGGAREGEALVVPITSKNFLIILVHCSKKNQALESNQFPGSETPNWPNVAITKTVILLTTIYRQV